MNDVATVQKKDIGKAFLRFETLRLFEDKENVYGNKKALRDAQIEEWYELFSILDVPVFESAIDMVIKTCKYWPTLAQVMEYVDEAQRAYDAKVQQTIKDQEAQHKPERTRKIDTKALLADMRAGNIKKPDTLVSSDVVAIARSYFPEMSLELITTNAVIFSTIQSERGECTKCMNKKYCRRGGYRSIPRIDNKTGHVMICMEKCPVGTAKELM